MLSDDDYMRLALQEAALAGQAGDVPVGAVIVAEGEVIASGRNRREESGDPTAHAEVEALRAAGKHYNRWHIPATLYVTQEPCPMCAGAMVNARVLRVVYGCANPKAGAAGSVYNIVDDPRLNHRLELTSGVLEEECAQLLKDFFQAIRDAAKERR